MGNSSSKRKNEIGGEVFKSYPSFSRTDTQGSTRSARSFRSRNSAVSEQGSSSKLGPEQQMANGYATANMNEERNNNYNNNNNYHPHQHHHSSSSTTNNNALNDSTDNSTGEGYPFPQMSLPRSMQQLEPKEPILIRRDEEGNTMDNDNNNGYGGDSFDMGQMKNSVESYATAVSGSPGTRGSFRSNSGSGSGFLTPSDPSTPQNAPSPRNSVASNGKDGSVNVDEIIQRLLDAGFSGKTTRGVCLKNHEIATICQISREIFLNQPTLLELSPPVKIVGDVHGQYGDLLRLFDMCGFPPAANYLFLGDYVDRGKQSLETILLLLCYKIKYPENFFLLRGNHECASVTRVYGFYDECKRRCNIKTWKVFMDTFNSLPIAAVVAHKIFCVHGGLSPSLNNLNEIRYIERPTDVPDYGLLNDLLWSDPADTVNEWEDNERGVSYCFSKAAINRFLTKFGFDLVCRAHMVVEDGYEFFNERSLVTVFSAPNYCGEFDNWGAVMSVSEELLCSFELLKPLDSAALKQEMRRNKHERKNVLSSSAYGSSPSMTPV